MHVNISHDDNEVMSDSREADSAGSSRATDTEEGDVEKDEEDVQKILTEINNEAI